MRKLVPLVWLMLMFACSTEEESLSETTQLTTKTKWEIINGGYDCEYNAWIGKVICEKCYETFDHTGRRQLRCEVYSCADYSDVCEYMGDYYAEATLDYDLNFWFEGESALRTGAMQLGDSSTASAGKHLAIGGAGEARFPFRSDFESSANAWVRVIAPSTAADSFYIQVGTVSERVEVPVATSWTWVRLPTQHFIPKGDQALRIYGGEPGVKIDRILLTQNPFFTPVVHTIQAEAYGWVPPMTTGALRFPPTTYIWVPNGAGTGGYVQLEADVPYAGNYVVWGRFNAPTEADNSFYLAKFLEERKVWNVSTTTSTGWRWDRAAIDGEPIKLHLEAGSILEIAQHEDGTKLDKIVLTNDPGFTLIEPASVFLP